MLFDWMSDSSDFLQFCHLFSVTICETTIFWSGEASETENGSQLCILYGCEEANKGKWHQANAAENVR